MLILTRKQGESITIGDDVKVTVLGVYGRQVRLGVEAPQKVVVHREEVYLKIKEEHRKSRTIKSDLMGLARIITGKVKGGSAKPSDTETADAKPGESVPGQNKRPQPRDGRRRTER